MQASVWDVWDSADEPKKKFPYAYCNADFLRLSAVHHAACNVAPMQPAALP
jgi:hypothetical protein